MPGMDTPNQICTDTIIPPHFDPALRPIAHLAPPAGWANDPNGLIQHRGTYHVFYQHNPRGAGFNRHMHWGHAVSTDLAHWQHRPISLAPDASGADQNGCYSGCALAVDGGVELLYSTPDQHLCAATAVDDELDSWNKDAANPLIDGANNPSGTPHFRDPCVFQHQGEWLMAIGSQHQDRGAIWLLHSDDRRNWEPLGPLLVDDGALPTALDCGAVWECPALFPLDGRWVLMVAACNWAIGLRRTLAFVGDFDGHRFNVDSVAPFDHSPGGCYAAATCLDEHQRRLLWGWVVDGPGFEADAVGWCGALSWPLALSLHGDRLHASIPDELTALRAPNSHRSLCDGPSTGHCIDIACHWTDVGDLPVGCRVWAGAHAGIAITVNPIGRCLIIDRSALVDARGHSDNDRPVLVAPLSDADLRDCHLRIIADRSLLQVHCNDAVRITCRAYPDAADNQIELIGTQRPPASADCWNLESCIVPV
jgi:beta-fructofuranosidase